MQFLAAPCPHVWGAIDPPRDDAREFSIQKNSDSVLMHREGFVVAHLGMIKPCPLHNALSLWRIFGKIEGPRDCRLVVFRVAF